MSSIRRPERPFQCGDLVAVYHRDDVVDGARGVVTETGGRGWLTVELLSGAGSVSQRVDRVRLVH